MKIINILLLNFYLFNCINTFSQTTSPIEVKIFYQEGACTFGENENHKIARIKFNISGGTPPYTYSYSMQPDIDTFIPISIDLNYDDFRNKAGSYKLKVIDSQNAIKIFDFVLTEIFAPQFKVLATQNTNCNIKGFIEFEYLSDSPLPYFLLSDQFNNSIDVTQEELFGKYKFYGNAGTYSLYFWDLYCSDRFLGSEFIEIKDDSKPLTVTSQTNYLNCGESEATSILSSSGGVEPYNYSSTIGGTITNNLFKGPLGTYTITSTDANGCNGSTQITITNNPQSALNISSEITLGLKCGKTVGTVEINVLNGQAPYSFTSTGGTIAGNILTASTGNYTVTGIDANGCQGLTVINIGIAPNEHTGINFESTINKIICGEINGTATLNHINAIPPVSYASDNGNIINNILIGPSGMYNITITDSENCTTTKQLKIRRETGGPNVISGKINVINDLNLGNYLKFYFSSAKILLIQNETLDTLETLDIIENNFLNKTLDFQFQTNVCDGNYKVLLKIGPAFYGADIKLTEEGVASNDENFHILNIINERIIYGKKLAVADVQFYINLYYRGPLPVLLSKFDLINENTKIKLIWEVDSEVDFEKYDIERSHNGKEFQKIGSISSNKNESYYFVDEKPNEGINYYRLKLIDKDGKYTYSKIVSIQIDKENYFFVENPVINNDAILVYSNFNDPKFSIYSLNGMEIRYKLEKLNESKYLLKFIQRLKSGVYLLHQNVNDSIIIKKLYIN